MALPVLKAERLYRQIANAIMDSIKKGEFVPGGLLPAERELAKQLGVSRSSVREALIVLEMTGWVDIRTGNGIYVAQTLPQSGVKNDIKETESFSLLVLTAELQQFNENDAAFLEQDKQFHLLISEMSGNDLLRDMMEYLWNKRQSPHFKRLERHYADNAFAQEMNEDHQHIAEAIVAGDETAARAAMEKHLQHVQQRLLG